MPLAQTSAPAFDLLILAFLGGFALATAIFWPLLQRAHHRKDGRDRSTGEGRHARGKHAADKPATAQVVGAAVPAPRHSAEQAPEQSGEAAADAPSYEDVEAELPELPNDLFGRYHAERFNRARNRLARIRADVQVL